VRPKNSDQVAQDTFQPHVVFEQSILSYLYGNPTAHATLNVSKYVNKPTSNLEIYDHAVLLKLCFERAHIYAQL
jgi:hypothetical protein